MVCVFDHYFQLIKQHDLTLTLELSYPTLSGSPGLPGKVAAGWLRGAACGAERVGSPLLGAREMQGMSSWDSSSTGQLEGRARGE